VSGKPSRKVPSGVDGRPDNTNIVRLSGSQKMMGDRLNKNGKAM